MRVFCPVHFLEPHEWLCGPECLEIRREFNRAAEALSLLWRQREREIKHLGEDAARKRWRAAA